MKICEQTVKPRARPLSDWWRASYCIPHHVKWHVVGANAIGFGATLDEAFRGWRDRRLEWQTDRHFRDYE
ncbi:MAG TPA: hypothetical protein VJ840_18695 [Gemmatimonadaceae bacterium]|nr:hypothetical protein [Gemmatimonadaceae bacterium]